MPLKPGKTKVSENIHELMHSKPSAARAKGIHTYMRRHDVSYQEAKQKLAVAAAVAKSKE